MRLFPVHPHDIRNKYTCLHAVPWDMLAPFEQQAQRNHSQSLEILASRGGLGIDEMWSLINNTGLDFKNLIPFNVSLAGVLEAVAKYIRNMPA